MSTQDKIWWKESVVYQIYPRSFNDSNGDGIGDLRGIIEKLDYLKSLGVDVLWLCPIYKSPNDDNGYDISDYVNIMDEFGTMADFDELLEGVHQRGMKLIMDLVVNHCSDEHEWFEKAKADPSGPYRDYFYWKKPAPDGGPPNNWKSFFGGSAWEYHEPSGEYFLHLFTKKQPDLNWENPKLREEVYQLMRFWLDKGIDGFRMDVIPLISKRLDFPDADNLDFGKVIAEMYANGPRVHEFLQEMHREVLSKYDVMTVGEAVGVSPEQSLLYVGKDRNELNMIFHFGHMFIDNGPGGKFDRVEWSFEQFKGIFNTWDQAMGNQGWGSIFLGNHDFPRIVSRFASDKEEFRVKAGKMLATLLLSLRGTAYLYQGDEIGMTNVAFDSIDDYRDIETMNGYKEAKEKGQDLEEFVKIVHHQGRDNARTPIQWDESADAGFTTGEPWIKVNPNYPEINVARAEADADSILHYYRAMLAVRKEYKTLVYGEYTPIDGNHDKVFAYLREDEAGKYLVVLNFSEESTPFQLPESALGANKQIIGNYPEKDSIDAATLQLRPFEARVYAW